MKNEALQKREIERTGDKVLGAVRLTDEEIDRITASPLIFDRIREGLPAREPVRSSGWTFGFAPKLAFALVLLAAIGLGAIGISRQFLSASDIASIISDVPETKIPKPVAIIPEHETNIEPSIDPQLPYRRARREVKTARATAAVQKARQPKELQMGEFQALTYTGTEEPDEGGRIVRVKLSPASLFAMGVDVPIENENDRITADLLIGADGVMKSVRLEKKN